MFLAIQENAAGIGIIRTKRCGGMERTATTMHNELTAQDIAMMQKELEHRKLELMPELIEEVKGRGVRGPERKL